MEIQTEILDDQKARLTVSIENDRLEKAKLAAARRISKRNSIRGFRKGKAPYPIVLRHFGEAAITEEAIEELGNEVYLEAITQSNLSVYGPGRLEDFSLQPAPKFTFTLDLQPEVDLNEYRTIRLDFDEPSVSDEELAQQIKALRFQNAVFEDSNQAVVAGDRVTIDYHATYADEPTTNSDSTDKKTEINEAPKGSDFARGDEQIFWLDPEEEPFLPGFRDELLGSEIDNELSFALRIPEEERFSLDIQGREIECHVKIRKIEKVTLPELNDHFAMNLTKDEDEPLTLLQLRQRIRENMQSQATDQARMKYIQDIQDAILSQANVMYPESMISDEVNARLEQFTKELNQMYNLKLEEYLRIQGIDEEELKSEFRPEAQSNLENWLVRDAIRASEDININSEMIDEEIDRIANDYGNSLDGKQRAQYENQEVRNRIANRLSQKQIDERIFEIGRGLAPDLFTEDMKEQNKEKLQVNQ